MSPLGDTSAPARTGCGPRVAPETEAARPLRKRIFDHVRAMGLVPRVQIARDLGISPSSVTTLTSELIEAGLLEETPVPREAPDPGRGRPPVALGVAGGAHHVAGLKLSDREHTAVVMDFAGNLVAKVALPQTPGAMSAAAFIDAAERLLDKVLANAGLSRAGLSHIGIGLPGFVSSGEGRVYWSSVLTERGVDLAATAAGRFGLPVTIDNDANLVALAELWFGAGRDAPDFAVVTIEHGLGMGVVINHRVYRGANELGTELGHMKVQLDGALCRCGQRGCLEAYVADYALAREATTALNWMHKDGQDMTVLIESLYDHAKAGNASARSIFRRAGRYLAVGLSNVVNLFDPGVIILSGERLRFDYLYADDTLAEMKNLVLNADRTPPPVEIHAWGDMLWAHGAAALALSALTDALLAAPREERAT